MLVNKNIENLQGKIAKRMMVLDPIDYDFLKSMPIFNYTRGNVSLLRHM
jgi:hypothetical protein